MAWRDSLVARFLNGTQTGSSGNPFSVADLRQRSVSASVRERRTARVSTPRTKCVDAKSRPQPVVTVRSRQRFKSLYQCVAHRPQLRRVRARQLLQVLKLQYRHAAAGGEPLSHAEPAVQRVRRAGHASCRACPVVHQRREPDRCQADTLGATLAACAASTADGPSTRGHRSTAATSTAVYGSPFSVCPETLWQVGWPQLLWRLNGDELFVEQKVVRDFQRAGDEERQVDQSGARKHEADE